MDTEKDFQDTDFDQLESDELFFKIFLGEFIQNHLRRIILNKLNLPEDIINHIYEYQSKHKSIQRHHSNNYSLWYENQYKNNKKIVEKIWDSCGNLTGETCYYEDEQIRLKIQYRSEEYEEYYYTPSGKITNIKSYTLAGNFIKEIIFSEKSEIEKNQYGIVSETIEINQNNDHIIEYYPNGLLHKEFDRFYKVECCEWDSYNIGLYREWYSNGQLYIEINYNDRGTRSGPCKKWYPNGQLFTEKNYSRGMLDGLCRMFNENGSIRREKYFCSGVVVVKMVD